MNRDDAWRIPLSIPEIDHEEIEAITRVLGSRWLTMGRETESFEREWAAKMQVKHAFAVCNGTAALHLANLAVGISREDEVICPALSFVATANASRYAGARVVFADVVSEADLTIDPVDIERNMSPSTKAVTVMHYGGYSCRMNEIMDIARRHNVAVIEDCAHAPFLSVSVRGGSRHAGTIGDVGCFSLFGSKNLTTGEGGMVVTNSDTVAATVKLLRSHAMTSSTWERFSGRTTGYDVVALGYNYRSDDLHSAIGRVQLGKIDLLNDRRREVCRWYREMLVQNDRLIIPFVDRDLEAAVCHLMVVFIRQRFHETVQELSKAGVQTSAHYRMIPELSLYHGSEFKSKLSAHGDLLTLPLYASLTRSDVSEICGIVNSVLR